MVIYGTHTIITDTIFGESIIKRTEKKVAFVEVAE
jgi:hypothetical protein